MPSSPCLRKTKREILQETIEEELETDDKPELSKHVSCAKMRHAGDDFMMEDSPDEGPSALHAHLPQPPYSLIRFVAEVLHRNLTTTMTSSRTMGRLKRQL